MAQTLVNDKPLNSRVTSIEIAESLRQSDRAGQRSNAIPTFGKYLRRGDRFQPTWDAIGGATGLASLMVEFSVRDVRAICHRLGRTATAQNARDERRIAMGELVDILYGTANPDKRPLQSFYQCILPACDLAVVQEWESKVDWTFRQQKSLLLAHREPYESRILNDIFSPGADLTFADTEKLMGGNMAFSRVILEKLGTVDGNTRIPCDTFTGLIMPVLKRLLHRRYDDESRDEWLGLVIRIIQNHAAEFKTKLTLETGGLIRYIIQRWVDTGRDRKVPEKYLAQVLTLREPNDRNMLNTIYITLDAPKRLNPITRYQLLRLLFQHMREFRLDLEDQSPTGLAKLKAVSSTPGTWPIDLLLSIDKVKAFDLVEKLEKLHPGRNFLMCPSRHSILQQTRELGQAEGDVEILKTLLSRALPDRDPHWMSRVREVVQERKKKATESRGPEGRAFWAKSTFNLCVATGNLEILLETTSWARRFNKDSLTTFELYNKGLLTTEEFESLMCAIPKHENDEAAPVATLEMVKRDIELADQLLIMLTQTAIMAISEPGFQRSRWTHLLHLTRVVADARLASLNGFNAISETSDPGNLTAIVWKPTMDTLLKVEALLRSPAAQALLGPTKQIEAPAVEILRRLPYATAAVKADLVDHFIKGIIAHLGPEALKPQMSSIVSVVLQVAHSDQPSLASPFIRDIIKNGDDSSWHRRVLNKGFLQSLPATAAREFVEGMADAMHELMKKQNARPWVEGQPPAIKVTTIKMMAQVLEGNLFLDPALSCRILVTLLAEARHIDARMTIVSSLLTTVMNPTCPSSLQSQIIEALEFHVIPIAAQLGERRPTTEGDWQSQTLPDVSGETPILDMLVDRTFAMPSERKLRTDLLRIVTSILSQSASNNGRWVEEFLKRKNFTLTPGERLPVGPVSFKNIAFVFSACTTSMPLTLFDTLREVVLVNIAPSSTVENITEMVKSDSKLVNSNAGKHWLRQYDNKSEVLDFVLTRAIAVLGQKDFSTGGEVTVPDLQQFLLQPSIASEVDNFASRVSDLIDILLSRQLPYHDDFWLLKDTVIKIANNLEPLDVAFKLGRLDEVSTLKDPPMSAYLRMEIVSSLLEVADNAGEASARIGRLIVFGLKTSAAERFREVGSGLEFKLMKRGLKGWFLKAQS
ncbi:hypothetical protein BN1708_003545 [Verticillium longisporum]|uniref:Uncharacterized protein n=1 Tax=Verticillium longisporum TaxID=100787 RepID=A0A0G4LKY2_VERLO|nr:hypothetical protein BN1708_003545 [Verticillium longisporum]